MIFVSEQFIAKLQPREKASCFPLASQTGKLKLTACFRPFANTSVTTRFEVGKSR